jgi:hypothetical protein
MGIPRRTPKGEGLQMIHRGPEGQGKFGIQRKRGKTDTGKPIKKWIETMQWEKADLEEKRSVVTLPMRGEHKPDSAGLIVWDDPVVNGVTYRIGENKCCHCF